MTAIPSWVWLAAAAALPVLLLGALTIGACIGGTKISRSHAHPCADLRGYGPDGDDDPGEVIHEPPAPLRIHPRREGL